MIKRTALILALGASLVGLEREGLAQPTRIPEKPVPTFTLSLPVTEGSFVVLRENSEVLLKPGAPLMSGDKLRNSSATPLEVEIRSAGGRKAGSLYLIDSTGITIDHVGMKDGQWDIRLSLEYGAIDSYVNTDRYGYAIESAGCTITAVGTHFLVERCRATDDAMTTTSVFSGQVSVVRPGIYKRYFPTDYMVFAGQQLRFHNTTFKTPRGFYDRISKPTKMVHRQADIMSGKGN